MTFWCDHRAVDQTEVDRSQIIRFPRLADHPGYGKKRDNEAT
jgi:hypothetical protein